MEKQKTIGIDVPQPKKSCADRHCPFHGALHVRGRYLLGKVSRPVFQQTATVEFLRFFYLPKFERYEKRKTRIKAHVPPCIDIKDGDTVEIMESRKISKTKAFVVIGVTGARS